MEPQKDLRQYVTILLNRKKVFIFPVLLGISISVALALLLPAVYQSSSTILIEEQQIPPEFVRSTVTGFADQRIQSLTQQILSRTKLLEIIQQFNLYLEMQEKFTREEIIEKMRHNIKISTISADMGGGGGKAAKGGMTIAFSISYQGKSPDIVQKVAGTLASLYLEQNLKVRELQAKTTTQFLEAELREIQGRIRELGDKIAAFKRQHENILPELHSVNMGQAERLENDIRQIDGKIRAIEDRKVILEAQLATVKPDAPTVTATGERVLDPKSRLKMLKVALAELTARLSENHPDVQKTRREMVQLEKMIQQGDKSSKTEDSASQEAQRRAQLQAALAQKQGAYSEQHPDVQKLQKEIQLLDQESGSGSSGQGPDPNPAYTNLRIMLQASDQEIAALRKQRQDTEEKLKVYRHRLEEGPKVEQEYLALMRNYTSSHGKHQEILNKLTEARISEGMEEHQKAEKFTLIDPASYPEKPVSPNRMIILMAGLIFSVGTGAGMVALMEHLDRSVKAADDLAWLTGLATLGTIPRIRTAEDIAKKTFRRRLIWSLGILAVVGGLAGFHFLYQDLWIMAAKVKRLINKYI